VRCGVFDSVLFHFYTSGGKRKFRACSSSSEREARTAWDGLGSKLGAETHFVVRYKSAAGLEGSIRNSDEFAAFLASYGTYKGLNVYAVLVQPGRDAASASVSHGAGTAVASPRVLCPPRGDAAIGTLTGIASPER
jgi:hypothetical protein